MKKNLLIAENHLEISNIEGYIVKIVTKFGNSAKIDCPKEYLGRTLYIVVV
jgi:putative transposon-encoded protein